MILPDPYRDELCARYGYEIADTKLRHILALMRMNMPVEIPPPYEELAELPDFTGHNQQRGCIPFTAEFEIFGMKRTLYLRYYFVSEFELPDDVDPPGSEPELLAKVSRLEFLTWVNCERDPKWVEFPIPILNGNMIDKIDQLSQKP